MLLELQYSNGPSVYSEGKLKQLSSFAGVIWGCGYSVAKSRNRAKKTTNFGEERTLENGINRFLFFIFFLINFLQIENWFIA